MKTIIKREGLTLHNDPLYEVLDSDKQSEGIFSDAELLRDYKEEDFCEKILVRMIWEKYGR